MFENFDPVFTFENVSDNLNTNDNQRVIVILECIAFYKNYKVLQTISNYFADMLRKGRVLSFRLDTNLSFLVFSTRWISYCSLY